MYIVYVLFVEPQYPYVLCRFIHCGYVKSVHNARNQWIYHSYLFYFFSPPLLFTSHYFRCFSPNYPIPRDNFYHSSLYYQQYVNARYRISNNVGINKNQVQEDPCKFSFIHSYTGKMACQVFTPTGSSWIILEIFFQIFLQPLFYKT